MGILLASSLITSAQELKDKDLLDLSLEELLNIVVTTASGKEQRISDAPATVISYSSDQIEVYGWRDLKDMFRAVTGIDISFDVQGEVKSLVTMRGIEGNQKILVLQDGQRQNPITGERFIFGHNIPLHIYKRIEIVYGPASALYGADAYAGVVNLITKDGADVDGVTGSVGYVSTNAVVSNLTFGKSMGNDIDVILSGRVYYGEDFKWHNFYKSPIDYKIVNEYEGDLGNLDKVYPINNWNFLGKIKYKRFTLGFDWQHQLESNAPSSIPSNYGYVRNNVWGQDIRHMYLNYEVYRLGKIDVDATITVGDYKINPASNFYITTDSDENGKLDSGNPGYKYGYSGYVQGSIKSDWRISSKLNIISGISFENVISFPKTQNLSSPYSLDAGLQDDLSYFVDQNGYTFGLLNLTEDIFGERNYSNFSSFVQAESKPTKNLIFTIGGRYDYNSIYKGTFNPRVGIVFKVSEKFTLKALGGTAYIAPSNFYRWENWANPYAMHIPNLDIKPERLQSVETSGIFYASRSVSLRTSVFYNNMSDIIRPISAPEQANGYPYFNPMRETIGESANTGFVEINDNLGQITSYGLEVDFIYRVKDILLSFGYSYTDGLDKETNSNLPKVSQHKLNTNISYTNNKLYGSITARYYSDIWTDPFNSYYGINQPNEGNIQGTIVVYTNIGYRLFPKTTLSLSVDNLLNTKHWGSAPYGESIWIQPRAPQSLFKLFAGINFSF
jgi:outer membrane receptor for ferrienterochelin and colicin